MSNIITVTCGVLEGIIRPIFYREQKNVEKDYFNL